MSRLLLAHCGEEPLEREVVEDRVDRRDAQQVADRRVRGRAATLAEDALALREPHDVVHDQESSRGKSFCSITSSSCSIRSMFSFVGGMAFVFMPSQTSSRR